MQNFTSQKKLEAGCALVKKFGTVPKQYFPESYFLEVSTYNFKHNIFFFQICGFDFYSFRVAHVLKIYILNIYIVHFTFYAFP